MRIKVNTMSVLPEMCKNVHTPRLWRFTVVGLAYGMS
jgi:hypothetical protein